MNISLAKRAKRIVQEKCHNGKGAILFREVFKKSDFRSNVQFLHETSVIPNSTIGYHKHAGNEEVYYVIDGKGLMVVDGQEKVVGPGDAVITYGGSSHGLKNIGNKNLKILVFEAKY